MKSTILFFCVISITFAICFYSSTGTYAKAFDELGVNVAANHAAISGIEDSARYFPLQIGNKYIYRHIRTGTCTNDSGLFVSRITDTVRYNGKLYYKMNTVFNWGSSVNERYFRYDAENGNLVGYDQNTYYCNYEKIQYKLTLLPNENLISMCLYLNPQTCQGIRDSVLFGFQKKVKIFYHSIGSQSFSVSSKSILAKDIGLTRYTYTYIQYLPGTTCTDIFDLIGAYVNGIVYGDTVTNLSHEGNEIPVKYSLEQNYPNPFNSSSIIRFQLAFVSNVLIKVYDVKGREVATIVNEKKLPGMYSILFDGSGLTSGIYFYTLQAGEYYEVRRMVFLK